MSFSEGLRALTSVQGVPQRSLQHSLQETLVKALKQPPPAEIEAGHIAKREANEAVSEVGNRQNVFVTRASLATFPVASGVITVIWKLLQVLVPNTAAVESPIIPLVLALLLGAFLVYIDLTDPEQTKPPTSRDKIAMSVIAFINSCFLTAAVLGIDTAVLQQ
jgi:uncharacterized membrane protein